MPRGKAEQTKVIYKGADEHFVVFVDSVEDFEKWKKDSSVPLTQVVNGWKVFVTQHGAQGILGEASKATLENEFGTSNEDEVVRKILKGGAPQITTNPERSSGRNFADGPLGAHGY